MSHSDMDMSSDSMSSGSMTMAMIFTTSHRTPLFSNSWTPTSDGGYAGTCMFLVILATILRSLFALKAVSEQRWLAAARKRRYVLVRGRSTEAARIDQDPDAKIGSLVTARGVEENVKVVQARVGDVVPFRLSVDVPRAILTTIIAGVSYLLMLAVMTMNVGYFLSVLAGTLVGELAVGRYAQIDEHLH
ncbi:uncharacterized protein Z518_01373 [Rhinocladiella mackenziei CBS 650.93]|uniref:Copper transport protein n=1 Tax=Rhinocladiella mackenziei CBS 650.93 TaxID=1442369 RepID=A0A0D2J3I2_9EURO|nr:uncharacterized protein Z518_01373 [Rhinocladiella mackenziei CBS 650.93]KIX10291.1 hypothetical protein Z518_01373 [Rhinocladiella mackenziei CBS 650.93]